MSILDPARCRALNEGAGFLPARQDDPDTLPALRIAGVLVFAYVHPQRGLVVSVDLDETDAELTRDDSTVPMSINVGDTVVFADPPHNPDHS
ncbi:hypothetical protein [Streptomyces sp. H51]|uniref:hypothetical protein n=1 Tax=Streptomyces sp. H51 TaxID=3111770 RepID=UPI002D76C4BF|nr:hypothetical protein [Streptomyces sp. H51]